MLGRGRGRQDHRFVVQIGDCGTGGLAGEPAGLETDLAGAEPSVVDNGFGAVNTLHGRDLLGVLGVPRGPAGRPWRAMAIAARSSPQPPPPLPPPAPTPANP